MSRSPPGRRHRPARGPTGRWPAKSHRPRYTLAGRAPGPDSRGARSSRGQPATRSSRFPGPAATTSRARSICCCTLISQHELDVTEVALHQVTDDFIAYTRALGAEWDLDQTTEFLVIAATLLDLKAARLLPSGEVEDAEDLALLEARDLLFARLLQYRAYKQVARACSAELEAAALRRYPRAVSLETAFAGLLPEVLLGVGRRTSSPELAATVFRPARSPHRGLDHLHVMPRCRCRAGSEAMLELLATRRAGGVGELPANWSPTAPGTALRLSPGSSRCWSCTVSRRCRSSSPSPSGC